MEATMVASPAAIAPLAAAALPPPGVAVDAASCSTNGSTPARKPPTAIFPPITAGSRDGWKDGCWRLAGRSGTVRGATRRVHGDSWWRERGCRERCDGGRAGHHGGFHVAREKSLRSIRARVERGYCAALTITRGTEGSD